jgi:hypothetical protein
LNVEQNLDVRCAPLLYTLAGLMITFAGFSALLLTLRPAAGARLSILDRYLARTVMTHIFVLEAATLLPPILALYDVPEMQIWKVSSVLFALPMLSLQLSYPRRRHKMVGNRPPLAILLVFVVFGAVVTLTMLGYVLAGGRYNSAAYVTAVTLDFFTTAFGFMVALDVIIQQPIEPLRPPPH